MKSKEKTFKIPLLEIKKDHLNVIKAHKNLTLIATYDGVGYKVFSDVCPHMGAPLSEGPYCSKSKTLECPWHGYLFSTDDLSLIENPNEKIWYQTFLSDKDLKNFKTPNYKLRKIPFRIEGNYLHLDNLAVNKNRFKKLNRDTHEV
tara:strand:- start:3711 stop:4148 length:438 start_codon:yes stop_codon:yes gene_type:complete